MIPGLMEPGRSEWYQGKQIGIPYGVDAYGLMVNRDVLDKAGVKPEFATWDAVLAACEKLKAAAPDVACLSHSTATPSRSAPSSSAATTAPSSTRTAPTRSSRQRPWRVAAILPKPCSTCRPAARR